MAKIFQSLKFTEGLQDDLKELAKIKGVTYNGYIESVLSTHVLIQKRAIQALGSEEREKAHNERKVANEVLVDPADEWK